MAMNNHSQICSGYQHHSWRLPVWACLRPCSLSALLYCARHTLMDITPYVLGGAALNLLIEPLCSHDITCVFRTKMKLFLMDSIILNYLDTPFYSMRFFSMTKY